MIRQQQRGISNEVIELLMIYGRLSYANGAFIRDMDNQALKRVDRDNRFVANSNVEKLRKVYLVEHEGKLITTGYKKRGFGRKFRSGSRKFRVGLRGSN